MAEKTRTARLFRNGRNQAVRIPREFEFAGEELLLEKLGDTLILSARPQDWSGLAEAVATHEFLRWIETPAEGA